MQKRWLEDWQESRKTRNSNRQQTNPNTFWQAGGLSAYAQAAAAVATFILGLVAYASWQDQEIARRRSDLAIEVLKYSYSYLGCLQTAWGFNSTEYRLSETDKIDGPIYRRVDEIVTRVRGCREKGSILQATYPLASSLIDARSGAWIVALYQVVDMVDLDYQGILYLRGKLGAEKTVGIFHQSMAAALKDIGVPVAVYGPEKFSSANFPSRLRDAYGCVAKLTTRLQPILNYKNNATLDAKEDDRVIMQYPC